MASANDFDGRFSLPAVDDPPLTEIGVILMGLDPERLLAGLGLATLADAPAQVALAVDQARHDALHLTMDALVDAGIRVWRSARTALAEAGQDVSVSASLRQDWARTLRTVAGVELGTAAGQFGPAGRAYLTACWLRRAEIDRRSARPAVPQTPGA
jgi:hypothetical protein